MVRTGGRRSAWRPLALLLALGVAAGCSQVSAGPSQAQYAVAADQVCTAHEGEVDEIVEEQEAAPDPSRSERWVRAELVPEYRKMTRSLQGIRPPEGDETYLAGLYADLDHQVDLLHASPGRGRALVSEDEDLRRRFSSYGMKVCGRV
ncbi:MAG TPA: hypothetical protein VEW93_09110 [Acidimicrobiales bacterium]|nr:hypothetical protein [Acidimicrobiales bacterium]